MENEELNRENIPEEITQEESTQEETNAVPEAKVSEEAVSESITQETTAEPASVETTAEPASVETTAEPASDETAPAEKKKINKKLLFIICGAAVAVLLALIIIIVCVTNNYKQPFRKYASIYNSSCDYEEAIYKTTNNLYKKEIKSILADLKKSDDFKEETEGDDEYLEETREQFKTYYGKNFKMKVDYLDKDKCSRSEKKELEEEIQEIGEALELLVKETRNFDKDDWNDLAEDLDLTRSATKRLIKKYKKLAKKLRKANVTKAIEVDVDLILKGKEDEDSSETTFTVVKIDGKWVMFDLLESMLEALIEPVEDL